MKSKAIALGILSALMVSIPSLSKSIPDAADAQNLVFSEKSTTDVYRAANPAVVTIRTNSGNGSGSIISADGLVLTNEHVIRSAANGNVRVITAEGKTYNGQVLTVDRRNDLALVRILSSDRFPSLQLADQNSALVGQQVFAIGSPFGLAGTLTTGILSRVAPNGDLQTDARLNPGNSGGPLLNSRGEIIGINKAILSPDGRSNTGIGFATGANAAKEFISRSASAIQRSPSNIAAAPIPQTPNPSASNARPQLGVILDIASLTVQEVRPNSLASRMGLQRGDRLIGLNGTPISNAQQLATYFSQRPALTQLSIARNRSIINYQIRL